MIITIFPFRKRNLNKYKKFILYMMLLLKKKKLYNVTKW